MPSPRMLKLLLVEDSERRKQQFEQWLPTDARLIWARAATQAIGLLSRSDGRSFDGLLLDHDLTQQAVTTQDVHFNGQHVVQEVIRRIDSDVPILVHSANVTGGTAMAVLLRGAGFEDVGHVPMPRLDQRRFLEWLDAVRAARAAADEDAADNDVS